MQQTSKDAIKQAIVAFFEDFFRLGACGDIYLEGLAVVALEPDRWLGAAKEHYASPPGQDSVAHQLAKFTLAHATYEIKETIPYLTKLLLVHTCSTLQFFVLKIVGICLRDNPADHFSQVGNLSVRVRDIPVPFDEDEWFFTVADKRLSELSAGKGQSARLMALLEQVGLSPDVTADVSSKTDELFERRHALVHRGGAVTARMRSVSRSGLKPGAKLSIDHRLLDSYRDAVHDFAISIVKQVEIRFSIPVESVWSEFRELHGFPDPPSMRGETQ